MPDQNDDRVTFNATGEKVPYVEPAPDVAPERRESLWPGVVAFVAFLAAVVAVVWLVTR